MCKRPVAAPRIVRGVARIAPSQLRIVMIRHGLKVFVLITTVRERILALRVDLMEDGFFESDETRWEIRSTHPKTGEEEFVLMRDTQMSKLMCGEIA